MLWQRVATAVVLLLLLLPALFSEAHAPLYAVALVFIAAGAWEWSRLNGYPGLPALLSGAGGLRSEAPAKGLAASRATGGH